MLGFLYKIFKWVVAIILSTILLLGAAWNVPETRDEFISIKEFAEEQWKVDLDEHYDNFWKHYNKFRGIRKDGF